MYEIKDLFDKRSTVGAKLGVAIDKKGYTKAEVSKLSGVSRPTIDKILCGTSTNKTTYEKQIEKILKCLELTPDMLFGNGKKDNQARAIRGMLQFTTDHISELTGIEVGRLKEIEAGEDATMAELRDIARSLSISVATLQGRSYFDSQVAELDDFVRLYKGEKVVGLSGFWGHIGILLNNTDKYVWYPVTSETRDMVYRMMSKERIVVPCMNNRLLFLNMDNVKEIILLDEACDEPACANWDPKVSCGEIPAVVFEALEDYMYDEDENMSPRFREYLERVIKGQGWSEDDINAIVNYAVIYFADGTKQFEEIQFDGNESITSEISTVYDFEDSEFSEDVLFFNHMDESERMINMKNIAMLEIPLAQIESAMSKVMDELEA